MTTVNPIVGVDGATRVNSPVVNVVYRRETLNISPNPSSRRRRSLPDPSSLNTTAAGNVSAAVSVGLNLAVDLGQFINGSSLDPYGMVYHVFNLTAPGNQSVIVQVTPYEPNNGTINGTLNVFGRANIRPLPTAYDWMLCSYIGNVTNTWPELNYTNVTLTIVDNYTIFLTANQTYNITQLMVGVQLNTGKWNGRVYRCRLATLRRNKRFMTVSGNLMSRP